MASVHDVAHYILSKRGEMTAMKLQKLVYYCQAWHLVWSEKSLFDSEIQAWANGPVIYDLYRSHKGQFKVAAWPRGDAEVLQDDERISIDVVLDFYGDKSAHWLSELTHRESPWKDARTNVEIGERSSAVITNQALFEYYDGLTSAST